MVGPSNLFNAPSVTLEPARISIDPDGTPYSGVYDDVYHSRHGTQAQARHVFIAGNDLPVRWQGRESFTIFETGFGLGLNFMTSWQTWRNDPQASRMLHFVSVEKHPLASTDLAQAHAVWPELAEFSEALLSCWPSLVAGEHRFEFDGGRVVLVLNFGDAVEILPSLDVGADAFYLDGFSPAKNPELWSPEICRLLARQARTGATLATWSVAGHVRQALLDAGFEVEKRPGFAGKRQMLVGRYRSPGGI